MKRMLEILVVAVIASAGVMIWKAGMAPATASSVAQTPHN